MKRLGLVWWRLMAVAGGLALCLLVAVGLAAADDSPLSNPPAVMVDVDVEPQALLPGEALAYTIRLENPSELDSQVTISATLPAGFEIPLTALPIGVSYNLRSGSLTWMGTVPAGGERELVLAGTAPAEQGADGTLTAYVTVRDGNQPDHVVHVAVVAWMGTGPRAAFGFGPAAPAAGQPVEFENQSDGVAPLSFWWDFGDGTSSTEQNPTHIYPGAGEYTVHLTVANPRGASSATAIVAVGAAAGEAGETSLTPSPYAAFGVSDDTPAVGQPIYFSGPSNLVGVNVRWNFGDGSTSQEINPTHIYQQPGEYVVTLVLGEGEAAVQSTHRVVVDFQPEATIQLSASRVGVGELVTLTALTSAPDVVSYYWDFGDGTQGRNSQVVTSYAAPGIYSVTLAVSNEHGVALDTVALRVATPTIYLPVMQRNAAAEVPIASQVGVQAEAQSGVPLPDDPLARQMLQAINGQREAAGLPPLTWAPELARSSQHHTEDMATNGFTGHYGSEGARPIDRMRQASYTGDYAGECTAWGFSDLESVVEWWMTSPPHRVIILSTVATDMGGAYTYNPDAPSVHYWTIDFGAR
jgi:PKD repeat protein